MFSVIQGTCFVNLGNIRSEILAWLTSILDCATAWHDPYLTTTPATPYAVLQLRRVEREGADEIRADGGPDEIRIVGTRLITVRVTVIGPDAFERLSAAQNSTSIPSLSAALGEGIRPAGDSGVIADDAGLGGTLELRLRVPFEAIDRPGEIERALVQVEVRRPDGGPGLGESIEFSR